MLEFIAANVLVQVSVLISYQFNKHLLQISYEPGSMLVPGDPQKRKAQFWKLGIITRIRVQHPLPQKNLSCLYNILYKGTYMTCRSEFKIVPFLLLIISCGVQLTCSSRAVCCVTVYNKCQWSIFIMYALIHSFYKYLLCIVVGQQHTKMCATLNLHSIVGRSTMNL